MSTAIQQNIPNNSVSTIPSLIFKTKNQSLNEKLIEIKDLTICYGEKIAIDHISMTINKNQITALIGPSGCGKSTFLRSLNRMNDEISGIRYKGEMIYENVNILLDKLDVIALRKEIGMVFQKPVPFHKSIYNNISYALKFYKVKKKAELDFLVEESLKEVGLWDEVKDRLHESALKLSGGQQQRLSIARTLAMKPQVLLLDEPTSALDPLSTSIIEGLLQRLKEKYTIIIVTHNMQQAARVSDRTAFFLNGKVIEENTTTNMFTNPTQKETEDYITGKFG